MRTKKILITGSRGFLGKTLTKRMVEDGNQVDLIDRKCFHRNVRHINGNTYEGEAYRGSIFDDWILKNALNGKDIIYHFAWDTHPKSKNHDDDLNTLKRLLDYMPPESKLIFPSTPTIDISNAPYEKSKREAEELIKKSQVNYTILRLSNVFGEEQSFDNPNRGIINYMIKKALTEEPITIYGDGNWIRDYSYVDDFMDVFSITGNRGVTNRKTYVLGSGIGRTFNQAIGSIKEIAERHKRAVRIEYKPFPDNNPLNTRDFTADITPLRKDIGWIPIIKFSDGLEKVMDYYISEYCDGI
jgi:nucleoside-diphosphate-sugar epimerase